MLIKPKIPSLPRNVALETFRELLLVFPIKEDKLYLFYSVAPEVFSSASNKAKLFAKNFSKNLDLEDSGISLPTFPSRTNQKLHNISVTPKFVRKVVTDLDLSKACGPDCIPVVVLKNCEPEPSYILAVLLNICLKECLFS